MVKVKKLGIENRPDLIWNADESGMPHEPKKCCIVSVKGQKNTSGNFPPTSVCSASYLHLSVSYRK